MLCPAQAPLLQDLVVSSLEVPESCYHFLSRESRAEFGRERCLKREECCSSSVPNREEVVSPGAPGSCLAGQTVREEPGLSGGGRWGGEAAGTGDLLVWLLSSLANRYS